VIERENERERVREKDTGGGEGEDFLRIADVADLLTVL